jgi:hypothetical protein
MTAHRTALQFPMSGLLVILLINRAVGGSEIMKRINKQ